MKDLLALTRMMNIYYHHLHNIAHGPTFKADHELMSDFYTQLESSYDSLIERYIGIGAEMDKSQLLSIITDAHAVLDSIPEGTDMDTHFQYALELEISLRAEIQSSMEMHSEGTKNLLAALADESEVRSYKLKQRVR